MLEGTESLELGAKFEIVPKHWQVASRTGWMFRRFLRHPLVVGREGGNWEREECQVMDEDMSFMAVGRS